MTKKPSITLVSIYNAYKKSIITTIVCAIIICFSGFVYSNVKLPAQEIQINNIQKLMEAQVRYNTKQEISTEVIKTDVKVQGQRISNLENDVSKSKDEIHEVYMLLLKMNKDDRKN